MAKRSKTSRDQRNKKLLSRLIILCVVIAVWGLSYFYISNITSVGLVSVEINSVEK